MNYLNQRMKEISTWLGLLSVTCVFSKQLFDVDLNAEQIASIQDLGVILAGGAGVAAKDGH
jgi:hypothetical protein